MILGGIVTKPNPFIVSIKTRGPSCERTMRKEIAASNMSLKLLEQIEL